MNILIFAVDPGGVNVTFPLIKPLTDLGHSVDLYGKSLSVERYKGFGIKAFEIGNYIEKEDVESLKVFVKHKKYDIIITGTSGNDYTERYLWKACESLKIPAFAIIDHWINYCLRFSNLILKDLQQNPYQIKCNYLPDKIFIMDDYAKNEAVTDGIPEEKIIVTGHPYFDYIRKRSEGIKQTRIDDYRRKFDVDFKKKLILFVSEPISETYKYNSDNEDYWGFNEKTIFSAFISALRLKGLHKYSNIIIRIHPKEEPSSYDSIIKALQKEGVKIFAERESDPILTVKAADIVFGIMSMMLIEAYYIGKKTVSIQIGLKRKNDFIMSKRELIKTFLTQEDLEREITDLINSIYFKPAAENFEGRAVNNILAHLGV